MTVFRVDLRRGQSPTDSSGPAHPDAHAAVRDVAERAYDCETPRFLVVDHAAGLVGRQSLYERLLAYGSVPTLCLALGVPEQEREPEPGAGTGGGTGPGPETVRDPGHDPAGPGGGGPGLLTRPMSLRPPNVGILWIPDPELGVAARGEDRAADPQWEAVRPLAELLEETTVFDAVLAALGEAGDGVAVPAPRVLEHDLAEGARERAWRQALEGLAGKETPGPPSASRPVPGEDRVPAELVPLLGEEVPKSLGDRVWCRPGGEADARRRACEAALRKARSAYEDVRSPRALLRGRAGPYRLPELLEDLAGKLDAYRSTAAEVLRDGDGVRMLPEQRALLDRRGIDLPEIPEVSRERVGPGLRSYVDAMLGRGLPLRPAASRLAALADRSAPAGSASRLARLDEVCPPGWLRRLASPAPFTVGAATLPGEAVPACVVAFFAGLWQGHGWVTGPLAGLAAAWLALFMLSRRPSRTADGRLDGGGRTRAGLRLVTGLVGGVLGAAVGSSLPLPSWAGPTALCASAAVFVVTAARSWTDAVDEWWARMRPESASGAVAGIETLLGETAVHDWLLGEARLHCADVARAASGLLRALAADVEAYGTAGAPAVGPAGEEDPRGARAEDGPDPGWEPWDWDGWTSPADADAYGDADADADADAAPGTEAPPEPAPFTGGPGTVLPEPREPADLVDPVEPVEPPWLERETGDGGRPLVETLVGDLADGMLQIVASCWAALERDPSAAVRIRTGGRVTELLDKERACLVRDGAAAPPPYLRTPGHRPGTAELLGLSTDGVDRLLDPGDETPPPRPLCAPGRRRMLSRDPGRARSVRFAPEAARRGATVEAGGESRWNTTGEDVVWTSAGRFAGVLRLVPLRGGTVHTVRPYDEPRAERAAHTGRSGSGGSEAAPGERELWGPGR